MTRRMLALAIAALAPLTALPALAGTLSGAGGTAIYPVLAKWADQYRAATGNQVNYQAIGSGGGIAQIKAKTVDFANSDKPLTPTALSEAGLIQFPAVIISIVPVVNLKGVEPGELTLDGTTLADIYLGRIAWWDDAAIRKLNPKATLPHEKITPVHRSDGSGTTFNFTNYLSKVSTEWNSKVGDDVSVAWPAGVGGKGNAGVANYVQRVDGAIGYVEYAYVAENHLAYTKMVNRAGKVLQPAMPAFEAAAAHADFAQVKDFYLILTDQPGDESWPITAATYMLMRKDAAPAQNEAVLKFMDWALTRGQGEARALDYVPLPGSVVKAIEASWAATLRTTDGKPLWSMSAK